MASPEELLATKILSMDARRLQDHIDARKLLEANPEMDLARVREDLRLIEQRGYHRDQDLLAKLTQVLGEVAGDA